MDRTKLNAFIDYVHQINETASSSRIHGLNHWKRVEAVGLLMAEVCPEADKEVISWFAYTHDSMRTDDGCCTEHGPNAAELIDKVRDTYMSELSDEQIGKLRTACYHHTFEKNAEDITVDICFDADRLDLLHDKADNYLHELDVQRVVNWLAIGVIILLLVAIVLFYLYHLSKVNIRRERVVNNLWNLGSTESIELTENTEKPTAIADIPEEDPKKETEPLFITRFREVVERRMTNSELSVEDLAAEMNLSRVQLYRKVKALTGSSPVELLRIARLNRAYQMLLTTDKNVSEVAYDVGFSAPAYFTKCFKDEFGMVPGEVRKSS